MMDILIAEDQLPVGNLLMARLMEKAPTVHWRELDEGSRNAYARHIALLDTELRPELGAGDLPEAVAFYNAYYWLLVFAKRHQAQHGFDAGIEQETFKALERAPADVDWQVLERVNEEAQQA